ncbi:hypothetical protein MMC25_007727 [Agyrium rufum]|nr:hypothetical protein [Agyrium rufum]
MASISPTKAPAGASKPPTTSAPEPRNTDALLNDPSLDKDIDQDIDIDMTDAGASTSDAVKKERTQDGEDNEEDDAAAAAAPITEARLPLPKKDISLREFLGKMDDYAPIIPDAVTAHALVLAGLPPPNPSDPNDPTATPLHLSRLLALATQKFIADVAADAYQYSRMRSGNTTSNTLNASLGTTGAGGVGVAGGVGGAGGAVGGMGGAGGGIGAGAGGAGSGGGSGGGGGAGGAGGAGGEKTKGATGQHVLGVQRAGFGGGGQGGGQGRTVLTMEDLGMAVGEYGVNVRRGEFYR